MPVKRQTKNVTATAQWMIREFRLWRTISSPTTTSSRLRAATTAGSIGAMGGAHSASPFRLTSSGRFASCAAAPWTSLRP